MWWALHDVSFEEVARTIGQADWVVLIAISVPAYLAMVYLRALRWRHLTDPIQRIPNSALARAVAVGFMANNIFPLRMGEVMRAWYLARETGIPTAAAFGTVVLERVLDTVAVIGLALAAVSFLGAGSEGLMARAALALLPVAFAPVVVLVALRAAPDRVIGLATAVLRPFPDRFGEFAARQLARFAEGLGALRGGSHLFWIAFHTIVLWVIAAPLPFLAGFLALDLQFATLFTTLLAGWITVAAVGVAVALPSAPGFFGTYHQACKLALAQFGVDRDTAFALGTLFHVVFWVTLTALGFAVLRLRQTSLHEMEDAAEGPEAGPSR